MASLVDPRIVSGEPPEEVQYIEGIPFYEESLIKSIAVPIGVSGIDEFIFYRCPNLQSVTIPYTVLYIGNSAFEGCYNITEFHCNCEYPPAFNCLGSYFPKATLYVPIGCSRYYREWKSHFATISEEYVEIDDERYKRKPLPEPKFNEKKQRTIDKIKSVLRLHEITDENI